MTHDEIMKTIGEKHRSFLKRVYSSPTITMVLFDDYNNERHLSGREYWALLGSSYQAGVEPGRQLGYKVMRSLWESEVPERDYLMRQDCLDKFNSLQFPLTIYRGMSKIEKESGEFGFSWSVSIKEAKRFAEAYKGFIGITVVTETDKHQVIAYFNHRFEDEVIFLHTNQEVFFLNIEETLVF